LNGVARLFEPLGDGALGDGFAHLGHDYVGRHELFSPSNYGYGRPKPAKSSWMHHEAYLLDYTAIVRLLTWAVR
jgi:hypothetical protein